MNKQAWMNAAQEKGWESFEIYQSVQKEKGLSWFEGQMDTFEISRVCGTSLRGVYDSNMAYYASEDIEHEDIDSVLEQMAAQAKMITTEDVDQLRQPEDGPIVVRENHWLAPSMEEVKAVMKSLEEKLLAYDKRVVQVASMGWQEAQSTREITNTNGIEIQDQEKSQYLVASIVVSEKDVVKDDYKVEVIHDLKDFDQDTFVQDLCQKALFKLNAKPIQTMSTPVIFEKGAMRSLFSSFLGLFNGELIYKGISPLNNKLDTKIFSDQITIVDDPRCLQALSIANYDDEGCPTRRKVLVSKGVFTKMLHNTKSATRMHALSTGNGFKAGYAGSIDVMPMNTYIEPGSVSLEQMMENMQNGFVITDLQGLHAGIDFVTTNFSLQCAGYWVENGQKKHAVSMVTVAANFMELMNHVEEVGNDMEWKYYTSTAPSIRFTSCSISGE